MADKMTTLITGYRNPDLDAVASALGYAELLRRKGRDVEAGFFGNPRREAQYVLDYLSLTSPNAQEIPYDECILVDASTVGGIAVDPASVVEIIDHRRAHEAHLFPNAHKQIEYVGSAATLIAERYEGDSISRESALLLYAAIASNTIKFKANVTTERDIAMACWLERRSEVPPNFVHDMFVYKSHIDDLEATLRAEYAELSYKGRRVGVVQLEIIDAEKYVRGHADDIERALSVLKEENSSSDILLTCIDVERGKNVFFLGEQTLAPLLGLSYEGRIAMREGIIMRKEMGALMKGSVASKKGEHI